MKTVFKSPVITKNTIYTTNEKFFNVDIKNLELYCLEDGVWYNQKDEALSETLGFTGENTLQGEVLSDEDPSD
jgi:hypothetical protein